MEEKTLNYDFLTKPITVIVAEEMDYILIRNDDYNVFGYGYTDYQAERMLEDDLRHLKSDLEEGLINESNTELHTIEKYKKLFGKE